LLDSVSGSDEGFYVRWIGVGLCERRLRSAGRLDVRYFDYQFFAIRAQQAKMTMAMA
jgi:hypothetical protein